MSDLFRKEALENRSRALYGEVTLKGPLSSWLLTGLILLFALVIMGVLFGLTVETGDGSVRLITWLLSGAKDG
jgi:hypothetical protein